MIRIKYEYYANVTNNTRRIIQLLLNYSVLAICHCEEVVRRSNSGSIEFN